MKKKLINDISEYVTWNDQEKTLTLTSFPQNVEQNLYLKTLTKYTTNNIFTLPSVFDVVNHNFEYLVNLKNAVKVGTIKKAICIREMVFNSVSNQNGPKIILIKNECFNKEHINAAKRYISEINNFCYKHNIETVICDKTFLYVDQNIKYWGHLDLVLANKTDVYQIEIKTSRTNYVDKYQAQLQLNKFLLENSKEIKVNQAYVLNIFVPQIFLALEDFNPKKQKQLLNITTNYSI